MKMSESSSGGTTNRIAFIDYARAMCMLWIIAFWHMSEYCSFSLTQYQLANNLTLGVLGTFTLISGFFCGGKTFDNRKDVISYLKRRLVRIYPLFFLSCISLYVLNLINPKIVYIAGVKQLVCTLLGLATFVRPTAYTVWYISMLIFLYILTPFIFVRAKRIRDAVARMCVIYGIVTIGCVAFGCDGRMMYLYPLFFMGLICGRKKNQLLKIVQASNARLVLAFVLAFGLFSLCSILAFNSSILVNAVKNIVISISAATFIGAISILISKYSRCGLVHKCLYCISISSYVAYLFHRQFFGAVYLIVGQFPTVFAYLVILPMLIAFSYLAQKLYDHIADRLC